MIIADVGSGPEAEEPRRLPKPRDFARLRREARHFPRLTLSKRPSGQEAKRPQSACCVGSGVPYVDIKKHLFRFARIGSKPEILVLSRTRRLNLHNRTYHRGRGSNRDWRGPSGELDTCASPFTGQDLRESGLDSDPSESWRCANIFVPANASYSFALQRKSW